ncbi:unnamed protein product [Phaeothamnion confervicola]
MITALSQASDAELPALIAQRVKQVAQPAFFLRMAELSDRITDAREKRKLETLAANVTKVLEKLLEVAEKKIDDSASLLNIVVSSCAEPTTGEFLVPLSPERLAALRQSISIHSRSLDEGFLATVQAWMKKSEGDGMEGMVVILQKVLQLYAAQSILAGLPPPPLPESPPPPPSELVPGVDAAAVAVAAGALAGSESLGMALLRRLLEADPEEWAPVMAAALLETASASRAATAAKKGLLGAVQVAIEAVVLAQPNGSLAQRVQAEFLAELTQRAEAIAPSAAAGGGLL